MINKVEQTGHLFEFLTMVHGYDAQGGQINKTYTNGIGSLAIDFPDGISHAHFGLRHGSCGMGRKRVEEFLIPAIKSRKTTF